MRKALRAHAATRALADAALEPVHGGLSNHAWQAVCDGQSWFVRLGGPDSVSLGVDRGSECALLASVAAAGLAPSVIACEPTTGLLVTRFVRGATWRHEDAQLASNIARIAQRLRVLHGLVPPAAVRKVDFAARADGLQAQLRGITRGPAAARGGPAGVAALVDAAWAAGACLHEVAATAFGLLARRQARPVPCHNDLHHLNLLDDGERLWIVDWEYGGVGDPLFDLASLACQHDYTAAGRTALLDAYGPAEGVDEAALAAACTAFDYVQWLWYLAWAARSPAAGHECVARAARLAGRLAPAAR